MSGADEHIISEKAFEQRPEDCANFAGGRVSRPEKKDTYFEWHRLETSVTREK